MLHVFFAPHIQMNKRVSQAVPRHGFSLIELLTVMAVLAVLAASVASVMDSSGQKFRAGLSKAADLMTAAHQAAVTQKTYVYVVFSEPDPSTGASYAAIVASKSGLDIAPFNSASSPAQGADFEILARVERFENIGFPRQVPVGSAIVGPGAEGLSDGKATFQFKNFPEINFTRFLKISPRGEVTVGPSLVERVQVVLQPQRGAEMTNPERASLVQISGLTGKVSVYQP